MRTVAFLFFASYQLSIFRNHSVLAACSSIQGNILQSNAYCSLYLILLVLAVLVVLVLLVLLVLS